MLPGLAKVPGHTFMPKRRPAESRPLLEEPPAFLVAVRTVVFVGNCGRVMIDVAVVVAGLAMMSEDRTWGFTLKHLEPSRKASVARRGIM